jgi:Mor family transcriptional regulator
MQAQNTASPLFDPLISELFDQLRVAPSDELTQTWRTIAAEVNLLTQRMALQRELQERARKLEIDLVDLRSSIMSHLKDVQNVADQQLTSARLRSEVSALAQTKLAAKLNQRR